MPWFDRLTTGKKGLAGRIVAGGLGEALTAHAALVLSLSKDGRAPNAVVRRAHHWEEGSGWEDRCERVGGSANRARRPRPELVEGRTRPECRGSTGSPLGRRVWLGGSLRAGWGKR